MTDDTMLQKISLKELTEFADKIFGILDKNGVEPSVTAVAGLLFAGVHVAYEAGMSKESMLNLITIMDPDNDSNAIDQLLEKNNQWANTMASTHDPKKVH